MEIIIHVESKKLDKNLQLAVNEYIKRTSPFCKIIIKLYKTLDKINHRLSSKIYYVIPGINSPSSEELSGLIENISINGTSCIEFVIKNNDIIDQLSSHCIPPHAEIFYLSSFSMSTDLTTVVLTEQIYRAYTITNNITYHK